MCMCICVCVRVCMLIFCYRSSDLIYYPILILLHFNIGFDNTLNKFAFQDERVKVKVAVAILIKLCHHSSAFINCPILILHHNYV